MLKPCYMESFCSGKDIGLYVWCLQLNKLSPSCVEAASAIKTLNKTDETC